YGIVGLEVVRGLVRGELDVLALEIDRALEDHVLVADELGAPRGVGSPLDFLAAAFLRAWGELELGADLLRLPVVLPRGTHVLPLSEECGGEEGEEKPGEKRPRHVLRAIVSDTSRSILLISWICMRNLMISSW